MREEWLPLTEQYLRIPAPVREQCMLVDDDVVTVQAVGVGLQIALDTHQPWLLFVEFEEWETGKPLERTITRGGVHVGRWRDTFITEERDGQVKVKTKLSDDSYLD